VKKILISRCEKSKGRCQMRGIGLEGSEGNKVRWWTLIIIKMRER
jgi:hypothetical protein